MSEDYDMLRGFSIVGIVIVCVALFGFVLLPVILQVQTSYNGEVTSVSITDYGFKTTTINFKDGSQVYLWGIYHISLGNHTLTVTSSWLGTNNLQTLDGAHP